MAWINKAQTSLLPVPKQQFLDENGDPYMIEKLELLELKTHLDSTESRIILLERLIELVCEHMLTISSKTKAINRPLMNRLDDENKHVKMLMNHIIDLLIKKKAFPGDMSLTYYEQSSIPQPPVLLDMHNAETKKTKGEKLCLCSEMLWKRS